MSSGMIAVVSAVVASLLIPTVAPAQTPAPGKADPLEALSRSFEQIAERVAPSVVRIFVSGYGVGSDLPNVALKQRGLASGLVIDPGGYIVTNAHVVAGATRVQVELPSGADGAVSGNGVVRPSDGRLLAEVVGIDTTTDLAVLKVSRTGLQALPFGDSDGLKPGQIVLAFGSPLGLGNTVTMGVVSAVARQLQEDDPQVYVQTDAPINPGNSGGPLVDLSGRVMGINTMIISQSGGSEGIGLAIPSNTVQYIAAQLRAKGRVVRGVIGVNLQTVSATMAEALRLSQPWGVIVADVDPHGPAAKAGLQIGDVILRVDGKPVENIRQFGTNLYRHAVDATVTLDLTRGAEVLTLRVPVMERPDDPARFLEMADPRKNVVPQLDLLGIDVDQQTLDALPELRERSGVLVAAMSADAAPPADRFQSGDVIHAVNGTPVRSLAELRAAVANLKDNDPVVVQIERQGLYLFVVFEID